MNEKNKKILVLVLVIGLVALAGIQTFAIGDVVKEIRNGEYSLGDSVNDAEKSDPGTGSPQMVGGC